MLGVAILCVTLGVRAPAQVVPGEGARIGTLEADRARVREILGRPDSAVALSPGVHAVAPTIRLVWNSALPSGGNDAGLWAGRGANLSVTGGIRRGGTWGDRSIDVVFAPEVTYSRNATFFIVPGAAPDRSSFASPWHVGDYSADLPLRFGDLPRRAIDLGQSAITMSARHAAFGVSTANEWWGPGLRNTLLLSNNAAGVPRLFVRTVHPVHTRFGDLTGRAFVGGLTESPYFDRQLSNDTRSLNGVLLMLRPPFDEGLTLGMSRLVMAPVSSAPEVLVHALDFVTRFDAVRSVADTTPDGERVQGTDQLFSLFMRWVFPESGVETYGEWSRIELPRSLREYLEAPQSTQGYVLGLQWARLHAGDAMLRLQGEVTYLEQTQAFAGRPPAEYYAGRAAVQGFTQRGQVLGAQVGPGGSSQFVAADWMAPRWQLGAFVERTRTENDALYRRFLARDTQHDVTLALGVRAGGRIPGADVQGQLTTSQRYNYLFQSDYYLFAPVQAIDIRNVSLSVLVSPR